MSRLHVVLRKADRDRISRPFLQQLESELAARGIRTYPALSDVTIVRSTRIYFYPDSAGFPDPTPRRQLFPDEKQFEHFMLTNYPFLDYFSDAQLSLIGQQVELGSRSERIDLLLERRAAPFELVGVELKHKYPHDGLVGQAGRYIEGLKRIAHTRGIANTRLVIITGQADPVSQRAVEEIARQRGARVDWMLYRVQLSLTAQ